MNRVILEFTREWLAGRLDREPSIAHRVSVPLRTGKPHIYVYRGTLYELHCEKPVQRMPEVGTHPCRPVLIEKPAGLIRKALAAGKLKNTSNVRAAEMVMRTGRPHVYLKHGQWVQLRTFAGHW